MVARALAIVLLAFCGIVPASAEDFSRVEIELVTGAPVDEFSPSADLGLPYADGIVARSYVVVDRPTFAAVAVRAPARYLVTVLYSADGSLLLARRQALGQLDAPVDDVTAPLKRILRKNRT